MITRGITTLFLFLFPEYCYLCKKEGSPLCIKCLTTFPKVIDTPYPFITSLYSFRNPSLKKIIHAIKYFHRKDLIIPFVQSIVDEITKQNAHSSCIIIPIPMPQLRKYMRGYNHAEYLAKHIAKQVNLAINTSLLARNKPKKRQVTTKSRSERINNQHNAFKVEGNVQGLHIILIDDVSTTGSTLREARAVLLKSGAITVEAYTIAH